MNGDKLRILQIGAGAMGMRRIRDSVRRDEVTVAVYDARPDRATAAAETFGIRNFVEMEQALAWCPQALIISTPPDQHTPFVQLALDRGIHHFCEANIWTDDWHNVQQEAEQRKLVCAPSCTFHFNPLISELKHLVSTRLGALHGFQFLLTTFMPDWHPDEGDEYYARQRSTTAAREMVPFELLWLNDVFGSPQTVNGSIRQRSGLAGMNEKLEDTWNLQLDLECGAVGHLAVFMGCPTVLRQGCCVGDNGLLEFDVCRGILTSRINNETETIKSFGFLTDLVETFYEDETNAFIDAILRIGRWPMSYRTASIATATLAAAELSSLSSCKERVDLFRQPAELPDDYNVQLQDVDGTTRHNLRRPGSRRPSPEPDPI